MYETNMVPAGHEVGLKHKTCVKLKTQPGNIIPHQVNLTPMFIKTERNINTTH